MVHRRMAVLILIFCISVCPTESAALSTFMHSASQRTYDDAVKYCKHKGPDVLPDDLTSSTELAKYMRQERITSVWVALKKKVLGEWTWTNDEPGEKPSQEGPGRVCAGLVTNTIYLKIQARKCNYGGNYEGYICEKQGSSCAESPGEYCFPFGNSSFTFVCGINDWYTAEVLCRKKGRVLAVLDSYKKVEAIINIKKKHSVQEACTFYWVGLRKEDWVAVDSGKGVRQLKESFWPDNQPQYGFDCCMASEVQGHIQWTTRHCNEKITTVCVNESDDSVIPERGNTTTSTPAEKSNLADESSSSTQQPWFIPVLVGTGVILILVLVATILYLWWKRRNKERNHMRQYAKKSGGQTVEDQSHSLDMQVIGEDALRKPKLSNVEQGTEEERRLLIEAGSISSVTKGRDNESESITSPKVHSEGKQLSELRSIPQNTTRNCETLGDILSFGKPILIGMVISSDQELHINKYLGENKTRRRSDIESTMHFVLCDLYKGILGWRSEESLEPRKLSYMNMLYTTRFVNESNTFYTKIKTVLLDIINLETYEKNRYTGKDELFLRLKDKHVIITRARQAEDGITDDAITVGVISNSSGHWCAYGYNPDFLVYTDYYKHKLYFETEEELEAQEVATIYTTVVASLVIMLAKVKVWEILKQPKLKSTSVMREILIRMCSHPHQKIDGEGYGVLDPWPFLLNWNKMKAVLNEVVK